MRQTFQPTLGRDFDDEFEPDDDPDWDEVEPEPDELDDWDDLELEPEDDEIPDEEFPDDEAWDDDFDPESDSMSGPRSSAGPP